MIVISGRGSNMMALVDRLADWQLPIEPVLVLSNRPDAAGLAWAEERGIATAMVPSRQRERADFEAEFCAAIDAVQPDLIALAGFMRILTPETCGRYAGRLLNIHPSLLPSYPGLHTHARAITDGVLVHGATVHAVTPTLDHGPVLSQAVVPVLPHDTPERLADRVLEMEHQMYPAAVAAVLGGLRRWDGSGWQVGEPAPGFEALAFQAVLLHPALVEAGSQAGPTTVAVAKAQPGVEALSDRGTA